MVYICICFLLIFLYAAGDAGGVCDFYCMKKFLMAAFCAALYVAGCVPAASAWDLSEILGGSGDGQSLGERISGAVTSLVASDKFELDDLTGTWSYMSPAVTFASDNALQKIGGAAAASGIEAKIEPYYTRIGLTNLVITVAEDHSFTMKAKMATLKGTITQNDNGELTFNFSALKKIPLGKVSARASKAGDTLILTFDVSRLISLMEKVSAISGSSSVKALSKMLSSYDGLYAGFKLKR